MSKLNIMSPTEARFYLVLWALWLVIFIWNITSTFRFGTVLSTHPDTGYLYVIIILSLLAWAGWNIYYIGRSLLRYREKSKSNG